MNICTLKPQLVLGMILLWTFGLFAQQRPLNPLLERKDGNPDLQVLSSIPSKRSVKQFSSRALLANESSKLDSIYFYEGNQPSGTEWVLQQRSVSKLFNEREAVTGSVISDWIPRDGSWIKRDSISTRYRDNSTIFTGEVTRPWDAAAGVWLPDTISFAQYSGGFLASSQTGSWDYENKSLFTGSRRIVEFDSLGFPSRVLTQELDLIEQEWKNYSQTFESYSPEGLLLTSLWQLWDEVSAKFINDYRYSREYEATKLVSDLSEIWSPENMRWENTIRTLYIENGQGLVRETLSQRKGPEDTTFMNYYRGTFTYDEEGKESSELIEIWEADTELWQNSFLHTYVTSADGLVETELTSDWNTDNQDWDPEWRIIRVYDTLGNVIQREDNKWNAQFDIWRKTYKTDYFFSPLSVGPVSRLRDISSSIRLYPNPARGHLQLEGKGLTPHTRLQLYDPTGRMLYAKALGTHRSLDLEELPSGNYILILENEQGRAVKRMVLE